MRPETMTRLVIGTLAVIAFILAVTLAQGIGETIGGILERSVR